MNSSQLATNIKLINKQANKLRDQGIYFQAVALFEKLLNLYKKTKNIQGTAHCLFQIGLCYRLANQNKKALQVFGKTAKFYQKEKMLERLANTYREIGTVYFYMQEYEIAKKWHIQSKEILKKLDEKDDYGLTLIRLGQTEMSLKNYQKADRLMQQALKLIQQGGSWFYEVLAQYFNGCLNFHQKKYQKAIDHLEKSETILDQHQQAEIHTRTYSLVWSILAFCHLRLGNLEMAKDYYLRALSHLFSMPKEMAVSIFRTNYIVEFIEELKKKKE